VFGTSTVVGVWRSRNRLVKIPDTKTRRVCCQEWKKNPCQQASRSSDSTVQRLRSHINHFVVEQTSRLVFYMGGVNHCRSHCRLAKFRGLMYSWTKYSALIGRKTRFLYVPSVRFPGCGFFSANHCAGFPPVHQTTEFRSSKDSVSDSG